MLLLLTLALMSLQISTVFSDVTSLRTDKSEYLRGEVVTISGTAAAGEYVGIQVKDPNGVTVWIDSPKAGSDGSFTSSFRLKTDAAYGTYTVYATPPTPPRTITFKVVPPPPPPPPPPGKKSSSLNIAADKTLVTLGENVTITGSLTPAINVTISLSVTCPNGTEVLTSVLASAGVFTYVFKPDSAGTWSVRASWSGNAEYYGCSSNTVTLVVRGPVSIQIIAAPLVTGVGSDIVIYVSTSPALADRYLTVSYITNNTTIWKTLGTFKASSLGIIACLFTPSEVGKYTFKVEWAGDPTFMPASATSSEVLVLKELKPEDIINALNQLKVLQELLKEKEAELSGLQDNVSRLQQQITGLQSNLSDAQSRISELESELEKAQSMLAEAESRVWFTSLLGVIIGLIIGLLLGFLIFRRRIR